MYNDSTKERNGVKIPNLKKEYQWDSHEVPTQQ